jgi:uncharacterized protein (TIGR03435 family)
MRKTTQLVLCCLGVAVLASQQTAAQTAGSTHPGDKAPAYEVVSIKPHQSGDHSSSMRSGQDGFGWMNRPLSALVWAAYNIRMDGQVAGLPGWAQTERYDIEAKMDAAAMERAKSLSKAARDAEEDAMLQSILAERCQFKAHEETKELPVYDLVIAKGGLKIKEAVADESPTESMTGSGVMTARGMAISSLTSAFSGMEGRLIVDKTGLGDKKFDFELKWAPEDAPSTENAGPSLFTALEEQLGLKLVPAKGLVRVLTIDHIERPSPN